MSRAKMYSVIKNSKKKDYSAKTNWRADIGKNSLQKVMEWSVNHLSKDEWTRVKLARESQNLPYSRTAFGNALRALVKIEVLDRTKELIGIQYRIAENADLSKEDGEFETESEIESAATATADKSTVNSSTANGKLEIVDNKDLVPYVENHIIEVRGERGLLDCDLAEIYGVSTMRLNEQRKRNPDRFPDDFAFQLNKKEKGLISQSAILNTHFTHHPWFYTREGCNQMSTVLNTKTAVERSIIIMRTFTDLERSAHGIEPKQDGFKELIAGIADNIFSPIDQRLQAMANSTQSNAARIDTTQKDLSQVKFEHEGRIAEIEDRANKAEKALAQKELPPPRLLNKSSTRQKVNQLVKDYALANNADYAKVWNSVYKQFSLVHHMNLYNQAKKAGLSNLEYLEHIDQIEELYAVTHHLLRDERQPKLF